MTINLKDLTVKQLIAELSTREEVVASNYDEDNTFLILIDMTLVNEKGAEQYEIN